MYYKPLLIPLLIQAFLVFFVWFRMYRDRLGEIKRKHIQAQDLASRSRSRKLLTDSAASSDNLMNQFEMPVLFFIAILLTLGLMIIDPALVFLSWLYVGLRIVHALIHIVYNNVMHRFIVYLLSCLALFGIWVRLGWYIVIS